MATHHILGKKGEDLASEYLIGKGHQIIARNYRHLKAEVDIISIISGMVVFTEVKTRSTNNFGYPEAAVSTRKKELLRAAMDNYLMENQIKEEARFDIISIVADGSGADIHHIEDAFYH